MDPTTANILEARDVSVVYRVSASVSRVGIRGVSLTIQSGTCVAVIGASGSGKTTIGLCCAGLQAPSMGKVLWKGKDLYASGLTGRSIADGSCQVVFQNPYRALNPRLRVGVWLERHLRAGRSRAYVPELDEESGSNRTSWRARVRDASPVASLDRSRCLELVRLPESVLERYPATLSGGERQRVCIAYALAAAAELVILDEPLSMLDPIAQTSVIDALRALKVVTNCSFMLISHDFRLVEEFSERILVFDKGEVIEEGATATILRHHRRRATRLLIEAAGAWSR